MENSLTLTTKKHTSHAQRQDIYQALLQQSSNGELRRGSISDVAALFGVSKRTVSRIWKRVKLQAENGSTIDLSSKKLQVVGRKRVQLDLNQVSQIPLCRRTTIRSIAKSLGVSKSTLQRRIKEGELRPHTNAIKPDLTHANKTKRLEFCLSMITRSLPNSNPTFHDMFNIVHIDEKWFYISKSSKWYYLVPSKHEPSRTCKSKKFITKVLF